MWELLSLSFIFGKEAVDLSTRFISGQLSEIDSIVAQKFISTDQLPSGSPGLHWAISISCIKTFENARYLSVKVLKFSTLSKKIPQKCFLRGHYHSFIRYENDTYFKLRKLWTKTECGKALLY